MIGVLFVVLWMAVYLFAMLQMPRSPMTSPSTGMLPPLLRFVV